MDPKAELTVVERATVLVPDGMELGALRGLLESLDTDASTDLEMYGWASHDDGVEMLFRTKSEAI